MHNDLVLTLSCRDRLGIVHAVSGFLAERDCNIVDSQQYGRKQSATFFMRIHFTSPLSREPLRAEFAVTAAAFDMTWEVHDTTRQTPMLIMASRHGHCLNDLLYRWRTGHLPARIAAVGSNHRDLEPLTRSYDVPFHYLSVSAPTRDAQERRLLDLVESTGAELVVLARYMQVLSPALCQALSGRVINIHHSFLPSFAGARPYDQAFARGVKLIGATAHYVTPDLDNGPIIEQEVARVGHQHRPADLAAIGRELECSALARAVRWHLEHRVLLDGDSTIVFS